MSFDGFLRYISRYASLCLWTTWTAFPVSGQVYVDTDATGANDGTSWADAYNYLQDALYNTTSGEIWVAEGMYKPCEPNNCGSFSPENYSFNLKDDVAIYGGFDGTETQLSQRDYGAHETILSGELGDPTDSTDNSWTIVYAHFVGPTAIIDGFIIEDGYWNAFGGSGLNALDASPTVNNCVFRRNYGIFGGAVWATSIQEFSPAFTNCSFINNYAGLGYRGGAAILLTTFNTTCSATFTDCTISDNLSLDHGGAITIVIGTDGISNVVFDNCVISNNVCDPTGGTLKNGGALYVEETASSTNNTIFQGCTFENNHVDLGSGGAVYSVCTSCTDATTFEDCTFSGNTAPWAGGQGGGLYFAAIQSDAMCSPEFNNCEISGNSAAQTGGGVLLIGLNGGSVDAMFDNTSITGNTTQTGGGMSCYGYLGGGAAHATLSDCSVDGNTATTWGGGVYVYQYSDPGSQAGVEFTGGSISNNTSAGPGGGIYYSSTNATTPVILTMANCTIDGNSATTGGGVELYAFAGASVTASLSDCVFSNNIANTTRGGGLDFSGVFNITLDAQISNTTFSGNSCPNGNGGGLGLGFIGGSFDLEIDACDFSSNSAGVQGGGLWIQNSQSSGSQVSVKNSSFDSNSSVDQGGGVYDETSSFNALTTSYYSNCTFNGNSASGGSGDGGGLYIRGSENGTSNATIINGLFLNNQGANQGGAVHTTANVSSAGTCMPVIANSTFIGNTSPSGNAIYLNDAESSIVNNILWDGGNEIGESVGAITTISNCIVQNGYSGNGTSTNILTDDPLFVDPDEANYHLTPCSPAVDAGDNAGIPLDGGDVDNDSNTGEQVDIDLDGNARIVGAIVDLGAYEYDGVGALQIAMDSSLISCFDACDGTASVTATDGTPGYTYSWSSGGSGTSISGLCPGTYTVTVTDNGLCEKIDSVVLTEPEAIAVSVSADTTVCPGSEVMLEAVASGGSGGFMYTWDQGLGSGATQTVNPLVTTTYTVTVTDVSDCTSTSQSTITVYDPVVVTIAGDTMYCEGGMTVLDAGSFDAYVWSTSESSETISVSMPGTYQVTVTDANSCTGTDAVTVVENPNPEPQITGDTSVCSGESNILATGTFSTYSWSTGETTQSISVSNAGPVGLTVTDDNGCSGTDSVLIIESASPEPVIAGDTSLCSGESTSLDAGVFDTYDWSTGETTQVISASVAGTYTVTVSNAMGCTGSDGIEVLVFPEVIPEVTGTLSFCEGTMTTLDAGNNYVLYNWSTGESTQTIDVDAGGTYTVTVTDANGCTGTDGVDVTEHVNPGPVISGAQDFCEGESTTLSTDVYTSYAWSTGETTQSINVSTSGTFGLTVTDANGCTGTDAIVVTEHPVPQPSISGETSFCSGENTTLDAGSFDQYLWSSGQTSQTIAVVIAGAYTVTVTDVNGCSGTDAVTVVELPAVLPEIMGTLSFCEGSGTTLDAGMFSTYAWSTGESTQTIDVDASGTFAVTVTDANGCTGTDAVDVTEHPNPSPVISGEQDFCEGESTTLTTDVYLSYSWSTGETTQSIDVSNSGTFGLTVTDANGCTGTDAIMVTEHPVPQPSISGETSFCSGESTTLDAGSFDQYLWSSGQTSQMIAVVIAGEYTVTVTDANGCTGTDAVTVIELPAVLPDIMGTLSFCEGSGTTLDAGIFSTYAWSTGETTQTIDVDASGTFAVTVTDANGCTGADAVDVTEHPNPSPIISGEQDFCEGESTTLTTGVFSSYQWSTGESTQSITVSDAGTFSLTVTDANGCTGTDALTVSEHPVPQPSIAGDTNLCSGENTMLDAGSFSQYLWSTGQTTQTILVVIAGTYTVTVTDNNGCSGTDAVEVIEFPEVTPEITGTLSFCEGSQTTLDAGVYSGYNWSSGQQTQSINVNAPGTYSVTVTDDNGCTGTDAVTVIENANPVPTISGDLNFCEGTSTGLSTETFSMYLWSTGESTQSISVSSSGTIGVTVTDANGCTGTDEVTVTENPNPAPDIMGETMLCSGESTELDAGVFDEYFWSTGETTQLITVSSGGSIIVTVTDANGCTGTDEVIIEENPPPVAAIAGSLMFCEGSATTLDAGDFEAYLWSTGETTQTVSIDIPGNFIVTVTDVNGCTGTDAADVEEIIVSPAITGQLSFCTGDSTQLSVGTFLSYAWSTGESTQSIIVSSGGSYTITVTDNNGCSGTDVVTVSENDSLLPEIAGDSVLCPGAIAGLDAGIFDSYVWSTGETTQDIVVSDAGVYTVTVSDDNGCTGSDEIEVVAVPGPTPEITGEPEFCEGGSTILQVGVYESYEWSNGETTQSAEIFNDGIITVTVTDVNGCTGTDDFIVSIVPAPVPVIDGDLVLCPGESTVLSTEMYTSYLWSTGDSTQSITTGEPGIYGLTVTDNTCEGSTEIEVIEVPGPEVSIMGSNTFCPGGSVTLDAGDFTGYLWSTGEQTSEIVVNVEGVYSITVTDTSGCTGADTISISEEPQLQVEITGDTVACIGDIVVLNAGIFGEYQWSTGETTQTLDVSESGVYAVTVSDGSGCTGTDDITVTIMTLPDPVIAGPESICQGDTAILDAGIFTSYLWSTGATSQTIVTLNAGTYSVTVTDAAGCHGDTSITVAILIPPQPEISGPDMICTGDSALLSVDAYSAYTWSTGESTQSIQAGTGGTYSVTVTNNEGCTGTATWVLVVQEPVAPEIHGQLSICTGSTTTLSVENYASYLWSDGSTDQSLTVSTGGTYAITVTSADGCTGRDSVVVIQSDFLEPQITGDTMLCQGSQGILSAGTFQGYLWSNGDTSSMINVTAGGTYVVTVSDAGGCTGVDSVMVISLEPPAPEITGELELCAGETTILDAGDFQQYLWSSGDTTRMISAGSGGVYTITVTDLAGCTGSASVAVDVHPTPGVQITGPLSFCEGSSTTLDAGAFDAYIWSTGDTTQQIMVTTGGLFSVTVTTNQGCSGSDSVTVMTGNTLAVNISGALTICQGSDAILDAGVFDVYLWSTGDTTQSITTSVPGLYSVTVSNTGGCSGADTINLEVNPPVEVAISGQLSLCEGSVSTLDAGMFSHYLWSTGDTTQSVGVSTTGSYSVTVSDESGCTGEAIVMVEVNAELVPQITGDLVLCAQADGILTTGIFDHYSWSTGDTTQTIDINGGGAYSVTVTDNNGCSGSAEVTVDVGNGLDVHITGDGLLCGTGPVILTAEQSGAYSWSTGDTTAQIAISIAGTYGVTVTDDSGCAGSDSITVQEGLLPVAGIDVDQTGLCAGDTVLISIFGMGDLVLNSAFAVSDMGNGIFAGTPQVSSQISVIASTECGTDTAQQQINVSSGPAIEAGEDQAILIGENAQLNASGADTYEWSPATSLSCTNCASPFASPDSTTVYVVTGYDTNGCSAEDSVTVYVFAQLELEAVNVITPNGDGINDAFVVKNLELFTNSSVTIFNRWGETVYDAIGYQNTWEGTYHGAPLPAGSYLYYVKVIALGKLVTLKGTVTIIRE